MPNRILPFLALTLMLGAAAPALAADPSPDALFPDQSHRGLALYDEAVRRDEPRAVPAVDPTQWASPSYRNKPVTYGDLARLREEVEEIKRRLAAQQNAAPQP